ncbi:MAG: DNA starvation/stationary phase protection protein [Gemmatimonadota bacterium]
MSDSSAGLNRLIADGIVLYQKLRHYHWHVEGSEFFRLHEKFEELYRHLNDEVDAWAERLLIVGGEPIHTLRRALDETGIQEDESLPAARAMVEAIVADFESMLKAAGKVIADAEDVGDRGTANLLDDSRDWLEKEVWMLRAWLKETEKPAWIG